MFEHTPVERTSWQGEEEIEPLIDQLECLAERLAFPLGIAFYGRWISHSPMGHHRVTWKYRAGFPCVIADGDHNVPLFLLEGVEPARRVSLPPDAGVTECIERERVDLRRRL